MVVIGEALSLLGAMAATRRRSFDVVLTDPPYQISRRDWRKPDGYVLVRDFGEDAKELPIRRLSDLFSRVLKRDASLLVWCSDRQVGRWVSILREDFDRVVVGVWAKANPAPNAQKVQWTQATELWVWAARGEYTFWWLGQTAMLNLDRAPLVAGKEKLGHPNQKPESICERHVRAMTKPGDMVLDAFAGSGVYGAICKRLGRKCLSIEQNPARARVAVERINNEREQLDMFEDRESPWKRQGKMYEKGSK